MCFNRSKSILFFVFNPKLKTPIYFYSFLSFDAKKSVHKKVTVQTITRFLLLLFDTYASANCIAVLWIWSGLGHLGTCLNEISNGKALLKLKKKKFQYSYLEMQLARLNHDIQGQDQGLISLISKEYIVLHPLLLNVIIIQSLVF